MTVINSNISALKAQSSLTKNARMLDTATERLSTGLRINSAKDDAAGLAITNRMSAQISGLNQAVRNANDGIAMIATIEGSLTQSTAVMQRMRELAVQSANGTNSTEDRQFLQAEMTQLNSELDRIASQARFNGMKVLDGTFTNKAFQIGANGSETIAVTVGSAAAADLGSYQSRQGFMGAVTPVTTNTIPASPVTAQTISLYGYLGAMDVAINASSSAKDVAAKINNVTTSTGVSADAETKVKITNLDMAGSVSLKLNSKNKYIAGQPDNSVTVTANIIDKNDLTTLADAFNTFSAVTGVTAQVSSDKTSILLTNSDGDDIDISNFTNTGFGKVTITGMQGDTQPNDTVAAKAQVGSSSQTIVANTLTRVMSSDATTKPTVGDTYSITLKGKNSTASTYSATVAATNDYTALVAEINKDSANSGITATLAANKQSFTLASNYNIEVTNFQTVTPANASATPPTAAVTTVQVTGAQTSVTSLNSTKVVGDLQFTSPQAMSLKGSAATTSGGFVGTTAISGILSAVSQVNAGTSEGAMAAISVIDGGIARISAMRASLGAVSSRLEKTVDALTSSSVNTAAARSRILDTDYAQETSALAKSQIIAQASTAMLAQANQQPQQVLQLLKQ